MMKLMRLVISLLLTMGCKTSAYRNFKINNKIAHFSFEYPSNYHLDGPGITDDTHFKFSYVGICAPNRQLPMTIPDVSKQAWETYQVSYCPLVLKIIVNDYSSTPDLTKASVEKTISLNSDSAYFKILDQSSVVVNGIQGESISYEIDDWSPFAKKDDPPLIRYCDVVYFDLNGLTWEISIQSDIDMKSEAESVFTHTLRTLKILE